MPYPVNQLGVLLATEQPLLGYSLAFISVIVKDNEE